MRHDFLETGCVDIDAVLCRNPTEEENDDGQRYQDFLKDARPLIVPTVPIGWLVTSRLEKYPPLTEYWFAAHGIRYKRLIMLDLPSKDARLASGSSGSFKARVYRSVNAELFIESYLDQAREIAQLAGKAVICMSTREIVYPSMWTRLPALARKIPRAFLRRLRFVSGGKDQ